MFKFWLKVDGWMKVKVCLCIAYINKKLLVECCVGFAESADRWMRKTLFIGLLSTVQKKTIQSCPLIKLLKLDNFLNGLASHLTTAI